MASSADKQAMDVDFPSEEDYEHLIEDYSHLAPPSEGELLQGHVVKVTARKSSSISATSSKAWYRSSRSASRTAQFLLRQAIPST